MDLALAAKHLLLGRNCFNCNYYKTKKSKCSHDLDICIFANGQGDKLPSANICKYWSRYE